MPSVTTTSIDRIVLTGFMGAGKSTLGPVLGSQLGWRFADIDDLLVEQHGLSIAALFERDGEAAFRRMEEQAIARALGWDQTVLALGGGALESESTRERLLGSPGTRIVFLETPLEVALERCAQQTGGAVRPVLKDRAALAERFHRRLEHYRQAHHTLSTHGRTPQELAQRLLDALKNEPPTPNMLLR
jgi:shikimate kinase